MDFFKKLTTQKNTGYKSLYRTLTAVGGSVILVESIVWSILSIISMIYYCWGGPHSEKYENLMAPFAYVITVIYYRARPFDSCSNIPAVAVFIFSLFYLLMSLYLIYVSIKLLIASTDWEDLLKVRNCVSQWILSVFVMSAFEFSLGLAFFTEFLLCSDRLELSIAAAAITLSAVFIKGFVLWCFNLGLSFTLFCIQYCSFDTSPV